MELKKEKLIVQKVLQNDNDGEFLIVEPNIEQHKVFKLTHFQEAFDKADIVVFLVAHNEFKTLLTNETNKVILNFCGVKA